MRHVLLVDDDPLILEVLSTVLDLEEFEVTVTTDGESSLELVADHRPDVVVCDVMMPGIDGYEVCRALKSGVAGVEVPVILLTARDRSEDRAAGEAAGCDAYLTKPFSPLHLIEVIRSMPASREIPPNGRAGAPPERGPDGTRYEG